MYTSPSKVKIAGLAFLTSNGVLKSLFLCQFKSANLSEILIKLFNCNVDFNFKVLLIEIESSKNNGIENSLVGNSF